MLLSWVTIYVLTPVWYTYVMLPCMAPLLVIFDTHGTLQGTRDCALFNFFGKKDHGYSIIYCFTLQDQLLQKN